MDRHPDHPDEEWVDGDPGPVVRPYAVTSGRTRPARGIFDLISIVMALGPPSALDAALSPESAQIIRYCQRPASVAELAAHLDLPAGTVKVLLGDLLAARLIVTRSPIPPATSVATPILEAVLHGLRSL